MASQSDSKLPCKDGRRDKRRSFLPAPLKVQTKASSATDQGSSQPAKTEPCDLAVGDRVLISGIKSGALLYFGKTHIAPGIWCGIALDDPDGKHDGRVEGVRYFNCLQGHGIFAPVERVEKLDIESIYLQDDINDNISPEHTFHHQKPHRRLLPQPKTFTRTGSREKIVVPSKIDEQNEAEEYLVVEKIQGRQLPERPKCTGLSKFGFKSHASKPLEINENEQTHESISRDIDSNLGVDHQSVLSETFVIKQGFNLGNLEPFKQISSDLNEKFDGNLTKTLSKSSTYRDVIDSDIVENTNLTDQLDQVSSKLNDLNRTFVVAEKDLPSDIKPSSSMTDSSSSNEDSLSTDIKECLLSDRREYFNITFDTENGGSPPQNLPNVNVSPAKNANEIKHTPPSGSKSTRNDSSLGVLNLEHADTDLLNDVIDGSANLTDSEKLLVTKPRQPGRIASVGDTFDASGALTSTPLIDSLGKKQLKEQTKRLDSCSELEEFNISKKDDSIKIDVFSETEDVKRNLNSTFKVDQSKPIAIIGDDTLDWRQEASDGEEADEISDNSADANLEIGKIEENINDFIDHANQTYTRIIENQNIEQLQKPEKPMIDSGISEMGDINNLDQGRMTDSVDSLRRSQNLDYVGDMVASSDSNFYEADQRQLEADLKAGHFNKKDRPLSLISADTGYVPDTDSEFGTVTNSPQDWADKQGLPQTTSNIELDEAYSNTFKNFQAAVMKGTVRAAHHTQDYDSDICSDAGTIIADTDTEREESNELENLSSVVHDIKGLSAEEVLPISAAKMLNISDPQVKTPTNPENFVFPEAMEDDRIEADQQLDIPEQSSSPKSRNSSETGNIKATNGEEVQTDEEQTTPVSDLTEIKTIVVEDKHELGESSKMTENECVSDGKKLEKPDVKGKDSESMSRTRRKKEVEKVEYKKPNLNVGSRLSDYINAPLPVKPKEESNTEEAKNKKNILLKKKVTSKGAEDTDSTKSQGEKEERIRRKVEKEPPKIIKRTPPKSKWGEIMSQIETKKEQSPTPKIEVKSKLQEYLSTPVPVLSETKKENKVKKKLPTTPKPDYSKVKSRLNIGAPAVFKREHSPGPNKRDQSPRGRLVADVARRLSSVSSVNSKIDLNESVGSSVLGSAISSTRGSQSDLNIVDGKEMGTDSGSKILPKPPNRSVGKISTMIKRNRRDSNSSTISDISQGSIKAMNARNLKLSDGQPRRNSMPVKSSIPPPTNSPKKTSSTKNSGKTPPANTTNKADTNKHTKPQPTITTTSATSSATDVTSSKTDSKSKRKSPNQNKNKTSKTKNHIKSSHQPDVVAKSAGPQAKQEITRLEALCESRTKELNYAKLQMKSNLQAFDAMAALVNYLSHDLDAFSCPVLANKLQKLQQQLTESHSQIGELQGHKSKLEQEIVNLNQQHEQTITELKQEHSQAVEQQQQTLSKDKDKALCNAKECFEEEMTKLKSAQKKEVSDIRCSYDKTMHKVAELHQEEVRCLQSKHENQMEELHKQHRDKLEDITHRFESIKMGLSEKVDTLRNECEDLKVRATVSEEALRKDSDTKVQMALAPFLNMPKEIESLKLVIELRNEEIQKLRKKNGDLEKRLEEIPIAREKIISLQQKIENLEAIVSMKTDHEKQLHEKCQMLMKKYDKESKANKRLSMDYEELLWKKHQGSESGSQENLWMLGSSPTNSDTAGSPLMRRKTRSPVTMTPGDVEKSPGRTQVYRRSVSSNSGETSLERKLKRRSANYLFDEKRTSPTGSPLHKRPHGSDSSSPNRLHIDTDHQSRSSRSERMCHSLNDADIFEVPQGLPNPPTPQDLKSATAILEHVESSNSQVNNHDNVFIGPNSLHSEHYKMQGHSSEVQGQSTASDSKVVEQVEQGDIHSELRDDLSDMSVSVDSCSVTSSSLCWDYEKSEWSKSMDSSQTSDSLLEQSTLTDSVLQQDLGQNVVNHFETHQCTSSQNSSPQRHCKLPDAGTSPVDARNGESTKSSPEVMKEMVDECLCVITTSPEIRNKESDNISIMTPSPEIRYMHGDHVISSFDSTSKPHTENLSEVTDIDCSHTLDQGGDNMNFQISSSDIQGEAGNTGKNVVDTQGEGHCHGNSEGMLTEECMRNFEEMDDQGNQSEFSDGKISSDNISLKKKVKESTV